MGKEKIVLLLTVALVLTGSVSLSALAAISFSQDSGSYAGESNLSGQGGHVGDGTYLNSNVPDARNGIGISIISLPNNAFGETLNTSEITVLNFDAYATSGTPLTHSTAVGPDNTSGSISVVWSTLKQFSWAFDASGITGSSSDFQLVSDHYNSPVSMSIVASRIANEVYGLYDYGSSLTGETIRYSVTDAQIQELNAAMIYVDYRPPTISASLGIRIHAASSTISQ